MERGRSQHQEDLGRQIILAPYVVCIWFTYKVLSVALTLRSLAQTKLPLLGRSLASTIRVNKPDKNDRASFSG